MLASVNLKERIVVASKSIQNYRTHAPTLLADLSNNAKGNAQIFLDTIFGIITSNTREPTERFYALYLLLKASENNPDQEFLIKLSFKEEMTAYISQTAQYDMDKVVPIGERGKTYFSRNPSNFEAAVGVNYIRLCAETITCWGEKFGKSDPNNIFYNFWFQNQIVSKRVNLNSSYAFIGINYQGAEELATLNLANAPKSNAITRQDSNQNRGPIQRLSSRENPEQTGIYGLFKKKETAKSETDAFEGQMDIGEQNKPRDVKQAYQETTIKPLGQVSSRIEVVKETVQPQLQTHTQPEPQQKQNNRTLSSAAVIQQNKNVQGSPVMSEKEAVVKANTAAFFERRESHTSQGQYEPQNRASNLMNLQVEKEIELRKPISIRETPKSQIKNPQVMTFSKEPTLQELQQRDSHVQRPVEVHQVQPVHHEVHQPEQASPLANNPFLQLHNHEGFKKAMINERSQSLQVKHDNEFPQMFRLNSEVITPINRDLNGSRISIGSRNSQLGQGKSVNIVFSDQGDEEVVDFNDSIFHQDDLHGNSPQVVRVHTAVRAAMPQGTPAPVIKQDKSVGSKTDLAKNGSKPVQAIVESPSVQNSYQDPYANVNFYKENPHILMSQNDSYKQENTYLMGELAKYQEELKRKEEKEKFLAKQNHFLKARVSGFDQELSEMRKTIGQLIDSNQQLHQDIYTQSAYSSPPKSAATGQFMYDSPMRNTDSSRKNIFEGVNYERPSVVVSSKNNSYK